MPCLDTMHTRWKSSLHVVRVAGLLPVLLAGCLTGGVGRMPDAPAPQDLANRGTDADRADVVSRYSVRVERDAVVVGGAHRDRAADSLVPNVEPEVRRYLAADADAAEHINPAAWQRLAWGGLGMMAAAAPMMLAGTLVPVITGVGTVAVMDTVATRVAATSLLRPYAIPLIILASMVSTCFIISSGVLGLLPGILMLIVGASFWNAARKRMLHGLVDAALVFNRNLETRAQAAAVPAQTGAQDGVAKP